jgi:hypothetical protein
MTPEQCRAARELLGWTRVVLSVRSHVSIETIRKAEVGFPRHMPRTLSAIRAALEAAGIEFIPENGGGAGVRLRKSDP